MSNQHYYVRRGPDGKPILNCTQCGAEFSMSLEVIRSLYSMEVRKQRKLLKDKEKQHEANLNQNTSSL